MAMATLRGSHHSGHEAALPVSLLCISLLCACGSRSAVSGVDDTSLGDPPGEAAGQLATEGWSTHCGLTTGIHGAGDFDNGPPLAENPEATFSHFNDSDFEVLAYLDPTHSVSIEVTNQDSLLALPSRITLDGNSTSPHGWRLRVSHSRCIGSDCRTDFSVSPMDPGAANGDDISGWIELRPGPTVEQASMVALCLDAFTNGQFIIINLVATPR